MASRRPTHRTVSCHPEAHEVLLFVPRDRASELRRRMVAAPQFENLSVSPLYRVGTGWAVTLCPACGGALSGRHRRRAEQMA